MLHWAPRRAVPPALSDEKLDAQRGLGFPGCWWESREHRPASPSRTAPRLCVSPRGAVSLELRACRCWQWARARPTADTPAAPARPPSPPGGRRPLCSCQFARGERGRGGLSLLGDENAIVVMVSVDRHSDMKSDVKPVVRQRSAPGRPPAVHGCHAGGDTGCGRGLESREDEAAPGRRLSVSRGTTAASVRFRPRRCDSESFRSGLGSPARSVAIVHVLQRRQALRATAARSPPPTPVSAGSSQGTF